MSADRCQPDREHFIVLGLDGRHRVISAETLSTGTKNEAPVDACAVFRHLVICGASGFIIAHNHPSGDLDPSRDDLELTRRLARGGQVVGVALLDHIITAPETGRAISLRQVRADLFTV
jgi:DNA repair protein RadC